MALGIGDCQEINRLMALEGHMREKYYSAFDVIINKKDFQFQEDHISPDCSSGRVHL
jgi:CRISPR-associated protein Cas1